ncbi:MAG: sigma-70 family RNA polymerase sigma factor [Pseudohongiellaceae bacterium]
MIRDNVIELAAKRTGVKAIIAAERQLVRLAGRGDRQAFKQIVEQNKLQLYRIAMGVVRHHELAEDVVQEAFLKAYKALPEFRCESRLATWLHRITFLTAIDCKRHEKARPPLDESDGEVDDKIEDSGALTRADAQLQAEQTRSQINRALELLSPMEQSVFVLRHIQNFKLKDIAEIVNRSEGTVKNVLFRAIRKLRQQLLDTGEFLQEVNRC